MLPQPPDRTTSIASMHDHNEGTATCMPQQQVRPQHLQDHWGMSPGVSADLPLHRHAASLIGCFSSSPLQLYTHLPAQPQRTANMRGSRAASAFSAVLRYSLRPAAGSNDVLLSPFGRHNAAFLGVSTCRDNANGPGTHCLRCLSIVLAEQRPAGCAVPQRSPAEQLGATGEPHDHTVLHVAPILSSSLKDSSPSSLKMSAIVHPASCSISVSLSRKGYFRALATSLPTVLFPLHAQHKPQRTPCTLRCVGKATLIAPSQASGSRSQQQRI